MNVFICDNGFGHSLYIKGCEGDRNTKLEPIIAEAQCEECEQELYVADEEAINVGDVVIANDHAGDTVRVMITRVIS